MESIKQDVKIWKPQEDDKKLPLAGHRIAAGFPSPADDFIEGRLSLNEHLIRNPSASFFVEVEGDSMSGAGIHPGDLLVVDRSLQATDQKIIIAFLDGEMTVKRLRKNGNNVSLVPENKFYKPIKITQEMRFEVWGVVTYVIHKL